MEFENQLRQAVDALANRLRDELSSAIPELHALATRDRHMAVEEATREAMAMAERDVTASLASAEERTRQHLVAAEIAAGERLLEAVRAIDQARSLTEVLDTLATAAAAEAGRSVVFITEVAGFRAWTFKGFGERADFALPFGDAAMIADAAAFGRAADTAATRAPVTAPAFAELPEGRRAVAAPLAMSSQVFAVLYADTGTERNPDRESWPGVIEILARHAAKAIEAITAQRLGEVRLQASGSGLQAPGVGLQP